MKARFVRMMILAASTSLIGCGAAQSKAANLMDDIHAYNDGVRWRQYPKAAARIHPKERAEFIAELSSTEREVLIAEWELIHIEHPAKMKAKAHVRYTWHLDSKGTVHETNTLQTWQRHGRRWLMVQEMRVRGEPMPGVEEPIDEDEEGAEDSEEIVDESDEAVGEEAEAENDHFHGEPGQRKTALILNQAVFEFR